MGADVPVVLFGAGSAGKELYPILKMHGVNPKCFCDNKRAGELHCGLPVISVSELSQEHKNSLIVVTTGTYRDEVKRQLVGLGFKEEKILTISNSEAMCYYTHLAQWHWPEEDLVSYQKELLEVYDMLSDLKSKEIYASRISFFIRGADYRSFLNFITNSSEVRHPDGTNFQECMSSTNYDRESYLQFNNDLISLKENEVLVDGGAFTGDSTLEFINACARKNLSYGKIVCFEPDSEIFAKLRENTAPYSNVELCPCGLWSHSSSIRFAGSNIMKPGSTKIITENDNNDNLPVSNLAITEIPTTSIDEYFPNENITFIKMDIEGAETEALRGAMRTISRCRPKLVISAYHKRNDIFEIPLLIRQAARDYKLYFRHLSRNFGETTLFAIPRRGRTAACSVD